MGAVYLVDCSSHTAEQPIAVGGDRVADSVQPDVTVEKMRQASMALMRLVPAGPVAPKEGRDLGRDGRGRDRNSDDESAVNASR
jgi:hypothetical protein